MSWYDHPHYFDLVFRDETRAEADFIEAACRKYAGIPVRRMLEPACGTGRLVAELAARGYEMTGFDLNPAMLRYARRRCARRRRRPAAAPVELFEADMADFALSRPVDAAFNTFNSFRHLLSEQAALAHLRCVADSVRPGGVYLLGLHLLPPDAEESCVERWTARAGATRVTATLRVVASSRRRRREKLRICLLVRKQGAVAARLRDEFELRLYTAAQLRGLLRQAPQWTLCDVFDFWYELDRPLKLTNELADTVLVLRREE